jgi:hypothetical protein
MKGKGEYICELSGDRWLCLLQAREVAAFLDCPLHYSGDVPESHPEPPADEGPEDVKKALAGMREQGPPTEAREFAATFGRKLHAAAVALIWIAVPYVIVPAAAMLFYWAGAAVLLWLEGDMRGMKGEFGEDVMMPMLAIVIPIAMVFARCLHVRVASRWVEARRRYLNNLLIACGVIFSILFGLVGVHDYCGWEFAGMHSMEDFIALGTDVWYFPIHVVQNYLLFDFFILVLLLPATYQACLRERLCRPYT